MLYQNHKLIVPMLVALRTSKIDNKEIFMKREPYLSVTDFERLQAIQEEMSELLDEAKDIIKGTNSNRIWERAKGYWVAAISMGLSKEHEYLGSAGVSMDDTLNELEGLLDEEELEEEYEDLCSSGEDV